MTQFTDLFPAIGSLLPTVSELIYLVLWLQQIQQQLKDLAVCFNQAINFNYFEEIMIKEWVQIQDKYLSNNFCIPG